MAVAKSSNRTIYTAIFFLLAVILLRYSNGFLEGKIAQVVGSIFGLRVEAAPKFDFSTIDLSWLNPMSWTLDGVLESINSTLHDVVDFVFPAVIYSLDFVALYSQI